MKNSNSPSLNIPTLPRGSLILASGSPRRREILSRLGLEFEIRPPDIDEAQRPGEIPEALVLRLAEEKAAAIARQLVPEEGSQRFVLGSDTVVVLDGECIGKPSDESDAARILKRLCGRTHRVITGIAVADVLGDRVLARAIESNVTLRKASDAEIQTYIGTGECLDKAGAYAIQGEGRRFVSGLLGSESNVIGLPIEETLELLTDALGSAAFDGSGDSPKACP